jgi:hypothetical protein
VICPVISSAARSWKRAWKTGSAGPGAGPGFFSSSKAQARTSKRAQAIKERKQAQAKLNFIEMIFNRDPITSDRVRRIATQ